MAHEIDTVSRTMVDTHFRDALAHRLAISEIAQDGLRQTMEYPRFGLVIFQPFSQSEKMDDRMRVFMTFIRIQLDTESQGCK